LEIELSEHKERIQEDLYSYEMRLAEEKHRGDEA
jgi:hypothetical protein